MTKICAWCKAPLDGSAPPPAAANCLQQLCPQCATQLQAEDKQTASEFLDRFDFPILLMTAGEPRTHIANKKACSFLGKDAEQIEGKLGGDMLECVYARRAGGCGRHIHCKACTIRKSVTYTHTTGKPLYHVPATAEIMHDNAAAVISLLISTEKIGECVLVRVESVAKAKAA